MADKWYLKGMIYLSRLGSSCGGLFLQMRSSKRLTAWTWGGSQSSRLMTALVGLSV